MEPLIPKLWSDKILRSLDDGTLFGAIPHMIDQNKLQQLIEQSADVPGVSDIHEALIELRWRRAQMAKLKKSNVRIKLQNRDLKHAMHSSPMASRLRGVMAKLKF